MRAKTRVSREEMIIGNQKGEATRSIVMGSRKSPHSNPLVISQSYLVKTWGLEEGKTRFDPSEVIPPSSISGSRSRELSSKKEPNKALSCSIGSTGKA